MQIELTPEHLNTVQEALARMGDLDADAAWAAIQAQRPRECPTLYDKWEETESGNASS